MREASTNELDAVRLQALIDAAVDGIVTIDMSGIVTSYSPSCEKLFGFTAQEVIGENVNMLMPSPYHEEHDGYLGRYVDTNEPKIIGIGREVVGQRKDGSTFPFHLSVGEFEVSGNRGFVGIVHDLTLRHKIIAASTQLGQIIEKSINEVFLFDAESLLFTTVNQGARANLGYSINELKSMTPVDIKPEFTVEQFEVLLRPLRNGAAKHTVFETVHERKDGSVYEVEVHLQLMGDGATPVFAAIILDVSDRNQAKRNLMELQSDFLSASRVSVVNEMAAALAHELNQPLTAIVNYLEASKALMAAAGEEAPGGAMDCLTKAVDQSTRAGEIIRRLRNLTKSGESEKQTEDLNAVITEACEFSQLFTADQSITPVLKLSPDIPQIRIDKIQIQQVITNLIRNASDALVNSKAGAITVCTEKPNEEYVVVSVSDTGLGIDPDIHDDLFEPFATTKSSGMGMGLSICKSIIEAHDGKIDAIQNSGTGTTFRFSLPLQ